MNNISGHDDVNSTQCPGRNLISYLPTLREHVDSRLGWSSATTLGKSASARELIVGQSRDLHQTADAVWHSLEGWYKAPGQENISYIDGYVLAAQYADPVPRRRSGTGRSVAARWRCNLLVARPLHHACPARVRRL